MGLYRVWVALIFIVFFGAVLGDQDVPSWNFSVGWHYLYTQIYGVSKSTAKVTFNYYDIDNIYFLCALSTNKQSKNFTNNRYKNKYRPIQLANNVGRYL